MLLAGDKNCAIFTAVLMTTSLLSLIFRRQVSTVGWNESLLFCICLPPLHTSFATFTSWGDLYGLVYRHAWLSAASLLLNRRFLPLFILHILPRRAFIRLVPSVKQSNLSHLEDNAVLHASLVFLTLSEVLRIAAKLSRSKNYASINLKGVTDTTARRRIQQVVRRHGIGLQFVPDTQAVFSKYNSNHDWPERIQHVLPNCISSSVWCFSILLLWSIVETWHTFIRWLFKRICKIWYLSIILPPWRLDKWRAKTNCSFWSTQRRVPFFISDPCLLSPHANTPDTYPPVHLN